MRTSPTTPASLGLLHESLPLRTVARLTRLSPDVIRAWERRYGVVSPVRGPRGARLYSSEDVRHLDLLARATESGRAIGDVARLAREDLVRLIGAVSAGGAKRGEETPALSSGAVVERALAAVERFDAASLERILGDVLVAFGTVRFVEEVSSPLLVEVGERWSRGLLSAAQEHLVCGMLRNLLASLMRGRGAADGPAVVLAAASGDRHECGLLLAALLLVEYGARVHYLGADLPAEEIELAARRSNAAVAGVGLVNGANQTTAVEEIRRLERLLSPRTEIWLGGPEADATATVLGRTRAIVVDRSGLLEANVLRLRGRATAGAAVD